MDALRRIYAVLLRHFYILRSSPARVIEIIYWPTMQIILWGFISQFFAHQNATPVAYALGTLLGAVILWDFLFRSQLSMSFAFLEEIWARNLGHLFVSPLRPHEWWMSMMLYSFIRTMIGVIPAILVAIPFYGFSIFSLGWPMIFLFVNLALMGWWLGLAITAILLRAGPGAESIAWALTFFLAPFCAVYYPISVLPEWLHGIAHAIPASHVFEGLRALVNQGVVPTGEMLKAFGLNCFYMVISISILHISFNNARKAGTLLQTGE